MQKQDGTIASLPIERLSDADQEYVKKRVGISRTTDDFPPATPGDAGEKSELLVKCQRLCEEITKGYKGKEIGGKATIAVVEFSDLSGGVTEFGQLLSEELITKLFATGKYKVIERLLLNKAIAEHKLQLQGLIDPKSAKELGKILGVDAIVSGTIATLGNSLRVNARLISTETGEVLSVAAVTIVEDDAIKELLAGTGVKPTAPGSDESSSAPDATNSRDMSVEKATAAGRRYIGTISYKETRQRILLVFTEQNGFLIRAEVSNPDSDEKQTFTGELIRSPKPEEGGEASSIKMSSTAKDYYGGLPLESFYRSSRAALRLRLTDSGLEGEGNQDSYSTLWDLAIRLQPGTAASTKPSRKATKDRRSGSR